MNKWTCINACTTVNASVIAHAAYLDSAMGHLTACLIAIARSMKPWTSMDPTDAPWRVSAVVIEHATHKDIAVVNLTAQTFAFARLMKPRTLMDPTDAPKTVSAMVIAHAAHKVSARVHLSVYLFQRFRSLPQMILSVLRTMSTVLRIVPKILKLTSKASSRILAITRVLEA